MMNTVTLNLEKIKLTDEQFFQLCANNRDLRFERNAQGDLVIMPPTGGETGKRNSVITYQLYHWNTQNNSGIVFDSSTGFKLPNGSDRSPDASWIPMQRWEGLTAAEKQRFLPLCPDFVIELRSPSDSVAKLQEKMREYRENGTRLGWLINTNNRTVEIYRQNQEVEVLDNPETLSGEELLPGFVLNLNTIW